MRAGGRAALLLSSSAAALLIGGGTPAALAACSNNIGGAFDNPVAQTTPCVAVTNTSFTGNITNEGTITPGGITFTNGTVTGFINSSGIIIGGIALDSKSAISAPSNAIVISGPSFGGGISSAGTISAAKNGILVGGTNVTGTAITITSFGGGISNSGTISYGAVPAAGILVGGLASSGGSITISTFSGGITNSGTITGSGLAGILVGGAAFTGGTITIEKFTGGISNSGTISTSALGGPGAGIMVGGFGNVTIANFADGIVNSGTIRVNGGLGGGAIGILVGGSGGSGSTLTISTFSGGISNSGTISATTRGFGGSGIVVGNAGLFSGGGVTISNFSGGINNSGTIIASSVGILVGGFSSGGSIPVLNFSGGITNTGAISISGSGRGGPGAGIMVSNVSTFMGGISNGGTIMLAHFGTGISVNGVAVFSNGVTNSGTISVNTGAGISVTHVATFLGNIFNSGSISVKSGTGIFVCNCATLAGGSIVNTGTITASTGIIIHNDSPISILNAGTITGTGGVAIDLTNATGGNTLSITPNSIITGKVLGFGNDTFELAGTGSGSFDLSGVGASAQYQGFTTFNVISGTWSVFNVFGQAQPWNVNGGILAGNGTLTSVNVNAGGTLEPGLIGAPGTTMTITGNLAFQPGSNYLVNLSPTTASLALVTGSVTLNGGVQGFLAPGSYSGKTTYDILDPTSISGKFTGYSSINAPGFTGTFTYQPNDVLLNLQASLGVGGGLNVNQQNVANGINNFFNSGGTLPADFFPIFGLTGPNLGNALSQLSGEVATGTAAVSNQMMTEFLALMLDPYRDGAGGTAMVPFAPDRAAFPPEVALAYASVLKAPVKAPIDVQRWTAWGAAFAGTNRTDGDPAIGSNNVAAHTDGFAAGINYRFSRDAVAGFSFAGGGTGWNLAQGLGTGRSDAFLAGAFGKTYFGPAYVGGALAFADHWFTTNRIALGDQLRATFNGQAYAGRLEAGDRFAMPLGTLLIGVTPYAALQTEWFHTPAYGEIDLTGGGFGLNYAAMDAHDTRGELGARFDELTMFGHMPMMLRGRLAWAHDWVSNPALGAAFQTLPGAFFTVNGAAPPPDSFISSSSVELALSSRWSVTGKFDSEAGKGSQTYAGTGTVRYRW